MALYFSETAMLLLLIILLNVAFNCHSQPFPTNPHTCRLVLRGTSGTSGNGFTVRSFSLRCWLIDGVGASNATVKVKFGKLLQTYLLQAGMVPDLSGVSDDWRTEQRPALTIPELVTSTDTDWGIDFVDVPHLKLVDTLVSEMPLSSAGPLVQCLNCSFLTAQNVTIKALQGGSSGTESSTATSFGAVRVTGLRGATFQGAHCSDVRNAMGWACILLQIRYNAAVRIEDSFFINNTVGGSASSPNSSISSVLPSYLVRCMNCEHDVASAGYGAVLIAYDMDDDLCTSGQAEAVVLVEGTVMSNNVGGCGAGIAVRGLYKNMTELCEFGQRRHVYLNFSNSNITGNTGASNGGGIYFGGCSGETLHVALSNRSVLSRNSADGDGGGAALFSPLIDVITITSSEVSDNTAHSSQAVAGSARNGGGGVFAKAYEGDIASITVHNSQLSRNTASSGGAFYVCADAGAVKSIIVGESVLQNNSADGRGGAMFVLCGDGSPDVVAVEQQSVLYGNVAGQHGGGIALEAEMSSGDVDLRISGQIDSNQAKNGNGGGIYLSLPQFRNVSITSTNLTRNTASCEPGNRNCVASGGGIFISSEYDADCPANGSLNIDQSFVANNTASNEGGAIYLKCTTGGINRTIAINGSTFVGNTALRSNGGAVSFNQDDGNFASCTISGSSFVSNNASGSGGALYLNGISETGDHVFRIEGGSVASSNAASRGGFAYVFASSCGVVDLTINGSQITKNRATVDGGALYYLTDFDCMTSVVVIGSAVDNNTANEGSGGGMYVKTGTVSKLHIIGASSIFGNCAEQRGGGISVTTTVGGADDVLVDQGSIVANNKAEYDSGGAIHMVVDRSGNLLRSGVMTVSDNSRIENNTAGGHGGAIAMLAGAVSNLTWTGNSTLSNNTARGGSGGGLYLAASASQVFVLGGSRWLGNTAQADGGALSVEANNYDDEASNVTVGEWSQIVGNGGRNGGAVYVNGFSNMRVTGGSSIRLNVAVYDGGALYLSQLPQLLNITSSSLSENNAFRGSGGGLYIATVKAMASKTAETMCVLTPSDGQARINIYDTVLSGNVAGVADGGAISLMAHETCSRNTRATLDIRDCKFNDNSALGAGGAVAVRDSSSAVFLVNIINSNFNNNTAGTMTGKFTNRANLGGALLVWREPADPSANLTESCQLNIYNSSFERNSCFGGTGGAVMLISCSLELSGSRFSANWAMLSGGAVGALHLARSTATLGLPSSSTTASGLGLELDQQGNTWSSPPFSSSPVQQRRRLQMLSEDGLVSMGRRRSLVDGEDDVWSTRMSYRNRSAKWTVDLSNCFFTRNSADLEYGGALYMYASANAGRVRVSNCTFKVNAAVQQYGGAAFLAAKGDLTSVQLTDSCFERNVAKLDGGGAVYALVGAQAYAALVNVTMTSNRAAMSGGAGILDVRSDGFLILDRVNASQNEAVGGDGGAMQLQVQAPGQVRITGSSFTDNKAKDGHGGAAFLDANCSSSVCIKSTRMTGNYAGASGGAIYVSYGSKLGRIVEGSAFGPISAPVQEAASPCPNLSSKVAIIQDGDFLNNTAGQQGGGIFLAPAGALTVFNSTFQGNAACEAGGSIASENCSSLLIRFSLIRNSSSAGTGGGLYAHGCRRILLEFMNVTGNTAAGSGGGLAVSGTPYENDQQQQAAAQDIVASVAGNGADFTSFIVHRAQVSDNSAAAQTSVHAIQAGRCPATTAASAPAAVYTSNFSIQQQLLALNGMGGGLMLTGKVVSVLNRMDLSQPNHARFGKAIATNQRCELFNRSSSAAVAPEVDNSATPIIDPAEMRAWDAFAVWNRLESLAAMRCWALQLSETLLPSVANVSISSNAAECAECCQQKDLTIWVDDLIASALQAKCSYGAVGSIVRTLTQEESSGDFNRYNNIRRTVSFRLNDTISKLVNRSDFFGLQIFDMLSPAGILPEAAVISSDFNGVSQKRFRRLVDQTVDCVDNPWNFTVDQRQDSLFLRPYVGLPPTYITLQISNEDLSSGQKLQLQAGVAFNLTAQLYDMFYQAITWDIAPSTMTLALRPRLPNEGPYTASTHTNTTTAWLNAGIANLDPGLNKSLTVPVVKGSTIWTGVKAYAWPGLYSLILEFSTDYPSSHVKVTHLEAAIEVLECQAGETLDLSRYSDEGNTVGWTGCKKCPSGQYGLWHDDRPVLTAILSRITNLTTMSTANSSTSAFSSLLSSYAKVVNDSLHAKDSSCRFCPGNALCLGGAVIVPSPGYWHSAANSTRIHYCPNPLACKVDGDSRTLPESVFNSLPNMDYRTRMLAWCQLGWYGSGLLGLGGIEAYGVRQRLSLPLNVTAKLQDIPVLLNSNLSPAQIINVTSNRNLPSCQLFGLPDEHPDSYMQRQCAEGYTGNLCAACVPNYYIDSDFNCKRCPGLVRTVVLGLISFFSSVVLVLFTTVTNFAEGFGEKVISSSQSPASIAVEPVEIGDIVKVIVLHLQYLIIVTRLSVDYPSIILRCQAVFNAITGAENYLVYSPSCLLPERDSAGHALIQWLAGILTPCAIAVASIMFWTIRYAYPFRKNIAYAIVEASRSLRTGMVSACISVTSRWRRRKSHQLGHRLGIRPSSRYCEDLSCASFSSDPTELNTPNRLGSAPPEAACWKTQVDAIGLCNVFRDVQVVTLDEAFLNLKEGSGPAPAPAAASHALCTVPPPRNFAESLPIMLPVAASLAPVVDLDGVDVNSRSQVPELGGTLQQQLDSAQQPSNCNDKVAMATATSGRSGGAAEERLDRLSDEPGILRASDPVTAAGRALVRGAGGIHTLADGIRISGAATAMFTDAEDAVAFVPYYHRFPYELWFRKTPKSLSHLGTVAISDAIRALRNLAVTTQQSSQATIVRVDKAMSLREQLGVVLMAAVFILYPSLAHAALSTFACYYIDDDKGPFPEGQRATWQYGYWLRNMNAMCYRDDHLHVYVPIGVVAVVVFCLLPPLASFMFVWRVRARLNDTHVRKVYGFLYKRYKPRFIWWETALQLETLILVSVEVLGRGLSVSYQALLLLAVFTIIALTNISCAPLVSRLLVIMEFISLGTLILTITLSLYFTVDEGLNQAAENVLAILIITLNTSLIFVFLYVASRHFWPSAFKKVTPKAQAILRKLSSIGSTAGPSKGGAPADHQQQHQPARMANSRLAWLPVFGRILSQRPRPDSPASDTDLPASVLSGTQGDPGRSYILSDKLSEKCLVSASQSKLLRAAPTTKGLDVAQAIVYLNDMRSFSVEASAACGNSTHSSHVCIQLDESR